MINTGKHYTSIASFPFITFPITPCHLSIARFPLYFPSPCSLVHPLKLSFLLSLPVPLICPHLSIVFSLNPSLFPSLFLIHQRSFLNSSISHLPFLVETSPFPPLILLSLSILDYLLPFPFSSLYPYIFHLYIYFPPFLTFLVYLFVFIYSLFSSSSIPLHTFIRI